jgi:quercetin dioxygenase-like cupin family protein
MSARDAPVPHAVPASAGERIWIQGNTVTLKATAVTTGGALTLTEIEAAPGAGPPRHLHEHEDEWFYALDGTFEIVLGGETVVIGPGGFAFVPRGTVHRFANVGDASARILAGFTPGGVEGFFRAAGRAAENDGPAPPQGPVGDAFRAAAAEHGMRVVDDPA